MKRLCLVPILLAVLAGLFSVTEQATATIISINPKATYLHTFNDVGALDTIPIELVSLGLSGGQFIRLQRLGDFDGGPGGDTVTAMIGVFSANNVLLASNLLNRVQDAIDAGVDYATVPTFLNSEQTDIAEDFFVDDIQIQIPIGATHLFVAAPDSFYQDNSDSNGNFAVDITVVPIPEPSTWLLFAVGILGILGMGWRQRKKAAMTTNQ